MVNKQGQTRLSTYFTFHEIEERTALESEIIRKCLSRTEYQCSFMEYRGFKVIYRRYASLFFIVGCDPDEEVRVRTQQRASAAHPPLCPAFPRQPAHAAFAAARNRPALSALSVRRSNRSIRHAHRTS
jgi:hypothetical protein